MKRLLTTAVALTMGILGPVRLDAADPVPFPSLAEPEPGHTAPILLSRIDPAYPAGVPDKQEHRIYVAFHVADDGRVRNATAMFNPPAAFAHAAVSAVEQWTFEPGRMRNGKPVRTQMTVEFLFKPGPVGAPTAPTIADEVLAVNTRMNAAANRLDTDAFFADIIDSDETRIIQDGKRFDTRAETMAAVRNGSVGVKKLDRRFEDPRVTVLGPDLALLTATGTTTVTLADDRTFSGPFALSSIFVRRDGRWMLFHGHYSIPNRAP